MEDLDQFFRSQRYSQTQDLGGPSQPVEEDSPVEDVHPVKKLSKVIYKR